ncbi:hypothetical protein FK535_20530 [Mycolicibacterium sp. 018/SC-01/001]|uniref:hypothetical protein n=1 Tax=Mycolicibacterium sp. 018/SC-01/001 TaxID=2592069 RepID=UPI00117E5814|nr:hypothetical protein [Mycolicibacterium sp. 018/SC-01/001]TRW80055.1 hypothetical protein FK535_20530 [Mycolicibacterium sp. 018/SC-01/001]
MRIFVDDGAAVRELTDGAEPVIRVSAPDLQRARQVRSRIRSGPGDASVILDVTVAVDRDFRAARSAFDSQPGDTVRYAGSLAGLVGLIGDIESAGVADGVTLIGVSARQDLDRIGRDVVRALTQRDQARAS